MNRQTLAEATSLHDGPVPIYLMEEIARSTKESVRDAEKVADFMVGRLSKSNLIVKLKALQLIAYCVREGSPAFSTAVREEEQDLAAYLQYTGPPDPVYGDERYRRIRVAAQEALVCLNDGSLSRHTGGGWHPASHTAAPSNAQPPVPYRDQQPQPQQQQQPYGGGGGASNYDAQQQGRFHDNDHHAPPAQQQQQQSAQPWGNPNNSQYAGARPAPYQDTPSNASSYGGNPSDSYNARPPQYGGSNYGGPSGGPGGYGHGAADSSSSGGYGYNPNANRGNSNAPPPHASGLDSWSAAPVGGAPIKAAGAGGMWSSSGYQKKDPAMSTDLPRYHATSLARDNRPTVLVGQSLNFPKPVSGYSGASSSGGYGGSSGGSSAYGGISSAGGAYGGPSGGSSGAYGGPSGGAYGGNTSGYGGNSNVGAYGGASGGYGGAQQTSGTGSYMDNNPHRFGNSSSVNHNRGMGLTNTQPLHVQAAPTTKLGKTVEGLRKISNEARERWDRRNMDKSMASSLADNDELHAGASGALDRGMPFQPNAAQYGAGGGDTSRDYERGMIDNLCASVGLSRAPPADALKRFVDLAQTLDVQTIGDILLDKLEDPSWQVRLKGLHVVVALLESSNGAQYMDWFEENVDVLEALRQDAKPSVVSKTLQILRILGFADESETPLPPPVAKRTLMRSDQSANAASSAAVMHAQSPASVRRGGANEEVDLLGFGSLSIDPSASTPASSVLQQQPNIYGSPPNVPAHPHAPPAPPQEVSLLDDFDPLSSSSSSSYASSQQHPMQQQQPQFHHAHHHLQQQPQHQQQHQQHAPPAPLDDRSHTLGHFGKDLFAIANSPRHSVSSESSSAVAAPPNSEKSAFGFM